MKNKLLWLLVFSFLLIGNAWAATVYVDAANSTGIEDGTLANPFNTIQEGINAAVANDIVSVAPGIYHGALTLKNAVKVISQQGPEVTHIDGMGAYQAVRQPYTLTANTYIEGFKIYGSSVGIYVQNRVSFWAYNSMEIHKCIFKDMGTGVIVYPSADVTITRSLFYFMNRAVDAIWSRPVKLKNVTMDMVLQPVLMYQVYTYMDNTTISHANTIFAIWGNRGWGSVYGSNNNFTTYANMSGPNWRGWYPYIGVTGSLYVNPQFIMELPHGVDYRLSETSPLIDAGIDVGLPFIGAAPDIGAFESDYYVSPEELAQQLAESYQETPVEAFKNAGEQRRKAMHNKMMAVLEKMDSLTEEMTSDEKIAVYEECRNKLTNDILAKADGFYGGNPNNDWIVTQEEQDLLYPKIQELLTAIQEEIDLLNGGV